MPTNLHFANSVVFVKNIEASKKFYSELMGLKIVQDSEVFILFENNFSIHQARELVNTIYGNEPESVNQLQGRINLLLYFESTDLEGEFERLKNHVELIHPIKQQTWGQKVFRFYDPDHHIIEIGETA